jgi:hypothetical protein
LLDYLAGSAVLEGDPEVYSRAGDPYQLRESVYGIAPEILVPVRQDIRDDVLGGQASLFRQVALDAAPQALPLGTALSALSPARPVFDSTRLWQRDNVRELSRQAVRVHRHRRGSPVSHPARRISGRLLVA